MTAFAEGAHTEAGATPGAAEAEYAVNPGPTDGQTAEIRSLAVRGLAGGGAAVDIALDSKVRYGLMELENPDRLIVDIPGGRVSRNVKRITEAPAGGISRIRVGAHQDKGRVVLDLDGGIPQYNVVNAGKRIRIFIAVKEGNAQISGLPFHKTDVAVSPAADMKPAKTASSIRDIQFRQYEGYSRVSIALSEAVSYKEVAVDQKTLALELPATLSKSELVRTLDVSEASGPVGSVSSFEDKARPGTAIIAVRLREATENRISMDGSTINWDFTRDREPAGKTAEVTEYAREKTAGATSITAISGGGAVSSKVYKGKRINLDFKEADIHNILRLVSDVSKLNIITSDDVRGKITLTLRNVPWDEALDIILQSKGLAMKQVGNILRIAPADVFQREAEAEFAKKKALRNLEPLYVRLIPVNYGVAQDIVNQVRDILSERGSVNIDTRTNVLIVKDMQENVIKAESLIRNLDTQTPQVLIESRIVEANTSFVRDVGIQWGGNITFSPATGNPTGLTFPSIVSVAGGADDSRTLNPMSGTAMPAGFAINMPSPAGAGTGGAIGFIFGSANGAFNLNLRLSAMESTGDV
jgi:type IV pilus assembly protein PilQ